MTDEIVSFAGRLAELRRRAARLEAEINAVRAGAAATQRSTGLPASQFEALTLLADGFLKDQRRTIHRVNPALPRRQFAERCADAVHDITAAEGLWRTIRYLLAQRHDVRLRPLLEVADLVAHDGYLTCIASAAWLGVVDPDKYREPPLVYLDAATSAATVARKGLPGQTGPGGFPSWRLPLPIIQLPFDYIESVWLFNVLLHEVGHDLDQDLGLRAEAIEVMRSAVVARGGDDRTEAWAGWGSEVLADAIGVLLGGAGFVASFASMLLPAPGPPIVVVDGRPHPPERLRARLLLALLRAAGDDDGIAALLEVSCARDLGRAPASPYFDDCAAIADALLNAPLRWALAGHPLRDLVPARSTHAAAVRELAAYLADDGPPPAISADEPFPWRLVPSAAALALVRCPDPNAVALQAIHDRTLAFTRTLPKPSWSMTEGRREFLKTIASSIELPILDRRGAPTKVPPGELLVEHDDIAFVGASHHRLPEPMRLASERRDGRLWGHIEIFFLADSTLAWFALPELPRKKLRRLRDKARRVIADLLDKTAHAYTFYEYDRPLLFASFWDWTVPKRGRIHVSSAIWGVDVARAPGFDHLRLSEPPTDPYATYVEGLAHLRQNARVLHRGGLGVR